jgi:multidrug efflux pump subunit AcrA (membrane-fusion protein)
MNVDFSVPEYPGRTFTAQLTNASGAVASASGTQLLQFQIGNKDSALKPGDYAEMHFKFPVAKGLVHIPATALMFRDEGMLAATVDGSGHVKLNPIAIQTDLGNAVEATGLNPGDRVIDNPSDSLQPGDLVKASPKPAQKGE